MKSKRIIKMPWLYNAGGDVSKQWCIRYSIVNPFTGKTEHIKVYKGANESMCPKERTNAARKEMYKLTRKLKNGWTKYDDGLFQVEESFSNEKSIAITLLDETCEKLSYSTLKKTQVFYKLLLKYLIEFLKDQKKHRYLHQITEDVATRYDAWLLKNRSAKTRNEAISLAKRIFNELVRTKKIELNPFQFFKKITPRSKPFKFFTNEATQKVNQAAADQDPQLLNYLQIIYYCTIRCKEARYLQIQNINLKEATLTINVHTAKLAKQRAVAIPEQLLNRLKGMKLANYPPHYYLFGAKGIPSENPPGKHYFDRRFKKLREWNDIDHEYKMYGLKHTGGIRLMQSGVDIKDIQAHMGHTTQTTTQVYLSQYVAPVNKIIKNKYPDFSALKQQGE